MQLLNRYMKGQAAPLGTLSAAGIGLLVFGVIIAFTLLFLAQAQSSLTTMGINNTTAATQTLTTTQTSISGLVNWLPMIVLAIVMVVILGLIAGIAIYAWRMKGA